MRGIDMTAFHRRTLILALCALTCAARADAANELCGQTVTQNLTFSADQSCTGTGLTVGANGITIDLGGFTLAGDQTSGHNGIELNGHGGITVKNGTVRHFDEGIHYFSVCIDGITISNLVVRDNSGGGLDVTAVSSWTIDHSAFIDNGSVGAVFAMFCNSGTGTVTSTAFVGNGGAGLVVPTNQNVTVAVTKILATRNHGVGVQVNGDKSTSTSITSSTVAGNGDTGVLLDYEFQGNDTTNVAKNVVAGNHGDGIAVSGDPAAIVSANLIVGNDVDGILFENHADGGVASKNRIVGNGGDGIGVDAMTAAVMITGNTSVGNQDNGIFTASATTTMVKNVANANAAQGILATGGAVDGGGNTARANGDLPECTSPIVCPPPFVAKPGKVTPTCGMHVSTSIKLGADTPICANMPGLIVDANGVTIDLNGHVVQGDRTPGNIGVDLDGHTHVTVKNGLVRGFDKGIYAATGANVKLANVEVRDSLGDGAVLSGSSGFTVTKSAFVLNDGAGLTLGDGTHGVKISDTFAVSNGGDGFAVRSIDTQLTKTTATTNAGNGVSVTSEATTAKVQASTAARNQLDGILAEADTDTIAKSTIAGNVLDGVETRSPGTGATLAGNVADGNGGDGLGIHEASHTNAMTKNVATGNGGNGLFVDSTVGPTTVAGNTADGNVDGITVASTTATLTKNVAEGNLDMGIDAPSGRIDGGGNKAHDNGGAADCSNGISCQ
jgi:parallel beta-helix repeat protein